MNHSLEYLTIGVYLLFLLVIGHAFSRLNRNLSDYVRGGGQGTWWMVGMSMMMAGTSTNTFVGTAGAVFQAGPTPLVVYAAAIVAGVIMGAFLAAWFRQTRAYTVADIYRERFGPEVEQFSVYVGIVLYPISAAVMLLGLAVFCAAVFGFAMTPTILGIGVVVIAYSTAGGKWAVLATDFFQGLILIPISMLVAWLSWRAVGGWDGFAAHLQVPAIARDFQWVKDAGQFSGERFDARWVAAVFASMLMGSLTLLSAGKFLAVKDGREAKKAAWFTVAIGVINLGVFFVPPMVARFLFEAEVNAMPLRNPAESAYAVIAMKLLPNGLLGVLIVAMFAATMSSMDTGLNGMTGTIVRNLLPPLRRRLGQAEMSPTSEVWTCKVITVLLGLAIITGALVLAARPKLELFDVFLIVSSMIGLPIGLPLFFGVFVRKLPRWSFFFIFGCAMVPPIWSQIDHAVFGNAWHYQDRILWVMVAGTAGMLVSRACWRWSSPAYRAQVEAFFAKMRRPIDYAREIGTDRDSTQLRIMGRVSVVGGLCVSLLFLVPNDAAGRGAVAFVAGFVLLAGVGLLWAARGRQDVEKPETDPS